MPGGKRGSDITLREAERTLKSSMLPSEEMPTEDARRLIHELRVHQIELEMQNEELRRAQNALLPFLPEERTLSGKRPLRHCWSTKTRCSCTSSL